MVEKYRPIPNRDLFTETGSTLEFQESNENDHGTKWFISPIKSPVGAHELNIIDRLNEVDGFPQIARTVIKQDLEPDFLFPFQSAYVVSKIQEGDAETIGFSIKGVDRSIKSTTSHKDGSTVFRTSASYSLATGKMEYMTIEFSENKQTFEDSIYPKSSIEENVWDVLKRVKKSGLEVLLIEKVDQDTHFSPEIIGNRLDMSIPFTIHNGGYDFSFGEFTEFEETFGNWLGDHVYDYIPPTTDPETTILLLRSIFAHGVIFLDSEKAEHIKNGENIDEICGFIGELGLAGILFKQDTYLYEKRPHTVSMTFPPSGVGIFYTIQDEMHPAGSDPLLLDKDNTIITAGGYIYTLTKDGEYCKVAARMPITVFDKVLQMDMHTTKKVTTLHQGSIDPDVLVDQLTLPEPTGWEGAIGTLPIQEVK